MSQHHQARCGPGPDLSRRRPVGHRRPRRQLIREHEPMSVLTHQRLADGARRGRASWPPSSLLRQVGGCPRPAPRAAVARGRSSVPAPRLPGALLRLGRRGRRHRGDGGQPRPRPVLLTAVECVRARSPAERARLLVLAAALAGLVLVSATAGLGRDRPAAHCSVCCSPSAHGTAYAAATELGRPLAQVAGPLALTTTTTTIGTLCWCRSGWSPRSARTAGHHRPGRGDRRCSTSGWSRWPSPTACSTRGCGPRRAARRCRDPARAGHRRRGRRAGPRRTARRARRRRHAADPRCGRRPGRRGGTGVSAAAVTSVACGRRSSGHGTVTTVRRLVVGDSAGARAGRRRRRAAVVRGRPTGTGNLPVAA